MGDAELIRKWCDEARVLLKLAKTVAPRDDDERVAKPELAETSDAALQLKTSFQQRFAKDPKGAMALQCDRMEKSRTVFVNIYSGMPSAERLELINVAFRDMDNLYAVESAQCARRKEVADRLDTLAPPKTQGSALVPGANVEDAQSLEALRDTARVALARADSVDEIIAMNSDVEAVALAREAVELKVETRVKQAERIQADADALLTPPAAPPGSLDAQRAAVRLPPAAPLSDLALARAEAAPLKLRDAWALVETEAWPCGRCVPCSPPRATSWASGWGDWRPAWGRRTRPRR